MRAPVAGAVAASLVASVVAFGAAAAPVNATDNPLNQFKDLMPGNSSNSPNPNTVPNLSNEDPAGSHSSKLNVTVGKSVIVSSDPEGNPGLKAMMANTQVSGVGSTEVTVPMGGSARSTTSFSQPTEVDGSLVYNVTSDSDQVKNLGAQSTSFTEQLPVGIQVKAKVNGKEVPAKDLVNVTGFVELDYTFTNLTSRPTEIRYRDPAGNEIVEMAPVAIPFAGAFSITMPEGFADVNAPWANAGQQPAGLQLSGTVEMIPPLGDLQQTLKITARAENASLPKSSFTAVPVILSNQKLGRMGLEYGPKVVDVAGTVYKYGTQGEALVAKTKLLLAKYGSLVEGYAARAEAIAANIVNGAYDQQVAEVTDGFTQLNEGVQQLDQLLPQATAVIGMVTKLVNEGTDFVVDNQAELDAAAEKLNTLVKLIEQYGEMVTGAVDTVLGMINEKNIELLELALEMIGGVCGDYDDLAQLPDGIGGVMMNITDAVDDSTLSDEDKANANTFLEPLGLLAMVPESTWASCAGFAPIIEELLKDNAAKLVSGAQALQNFIDKQLPNYVKKLEEVNGIAQYAVENQEELLKKLDNNNCKKTAADIKNCGIRQQMNFLNQMMNVATEGVHNQMLPGTEKLAAYVPTINKYFDLVKTEYAPMAEEYLAMVPGAVQKFAEYLGIADLVAGDVTKYAGEGELYLAKTVATLEAMDARASAGEGIPAGPATGANTNLGAYQYQMAPAADNTRATALLLGLSFVVLIFGVGIGTALYRRYSK